MNNIRNYFVKKTESFKDDAAFTLIELLVVIAIIGTLSTIAFVSLQSAQDSADDSKDIAQLRSIELALIQHKSTSGGFPVAVGNNHCVKLNAGADSLEGAMKGALPTFDFSDDKYFYCSDIKGTIGTGTSNIAKNSGTKYVIGVKNIDPGNKVLTTDKDGATPITGITMDGAATAYANDKGGCGDERTTAEAKDDVYCLVGGASS